MTAKSKWQTYECRGDAADRVAVRPDDLQRLMFGELHQQQIAPSSADPESCSALHQQGLHPGPGRRTVHGPTRVTSAEIQQQSWYHYSISTLFFNRKPLFQNRLCVVITFAFLILKRNIFQDNQYTNRNVYLWECVCMCTWWREHSRCCPPSSRSSYPKPLRAETQLCSGKRIYRRPSEKRMLGYPTTAPAWGTHTGNWTGLPATLPPSSWPGLTPTWRSAWCRPSCRGCSQLWRTGPWSRSRPTHTCCPASAATGPDTWRACWPAPPGRF